MRLLLVYDVSLPWSTLQAQLAAKVDNSLREPVKASRVGNTDQESLRVIFLAGSEYNNFRIGMENPSKSAVSIEVTDESGAIVHTDRMKKVYKRVKEMDFSFLKRREYERACSPKSRC